MILSEVYNTCTARLVCSTSRVQYVEVLGCGVPVHTSAFAIPANLSDIVEKRSEVTLQ